MKYKLTIVTIMTIILLAGGIFETIGLNNILNTFNEKLEILNQQENINVEDVEQISKWWETKHPKLSITISHVQLNEITITLCELKGAVKTGDYQTANELLLRIKSYSESLIDLYKFKFMNIV